MDEGIAALVGAAVGAAATTIGAELAFGGAIRQARIQARAEHAQWRRQVRREAFLVFHALIDDVYNKNWDVLEDMSLQGVLTPAHVPITLHESRRVANEVMERIRRARGAIQVEGPRSMYQLARQLDLLAHTILDEVAVLQSKESPEIESIRRTDQWLRTLQSGAEGFLDAAAKVLDNPDPTAPVPGTRRRA
ncbi:hypothetical protein [Streptomyces tubercidicus]|uniref:Uncharacterized protein n=1 Tax=Streptomyces tubercidicus TaxID=47759 RepID=A0A640UWS7_9ACTN|nr:hypothetical protein [Streptomyces tubercidicus]WAU12957.1 hypothetical protein STRTU_003386 [Streptomyces tubercidicus]GFE38486.1 hypothetical protein Stube_31590 [Streptomyces tubercidicus]